MHRIVAFFFCVFAMFSVSAQAATKLKTVGWVEFVRIKDVDMQLKAKLDTGATTSSIGADIINIKQVTAHTPGHVGEKVIFSLTDDTSQTKKIFERDIVRYVRIKKKDAGGFLRRPVVQMTFCIAGREVHEEVNLANRDNFIYPVLVGRNMMRDAGLVIDAARTYLSNPVCN